MDNRNKVGVEMLTKRQINVLSYAEMQKSVRETVKEESCVERKDSILIRKSKYDRSFNGLNEGYLDNSYSLNIEE